MNSNVNSPPVLNCFPADDRMAHRPNYVFTNNWFEYQKPIIDQIMMLRADSKPIRILEIGAHEGRSTVHYIDHYLHHSASSILSIDPFETGDTTTPVTSLTRQTFEYNIQNSRYPDKANLVTERSQKALCRLVSEDQKFDFISIDGSHLSRDAMSDAVLAFALLEDQGIVFFDDYLGGSPDRDSNVNWPKIGIDSFLKVFEGQYSIIHSGYHLAIRKETPNSTAGKRQVFDCFLFNNEIDLLRLRLNELKDEVDVFVLIESNYTFSGHRKPLYFKEHETEFRAFNIVHLVIDGVPDADPWVNEAAQRNAPRRYLLDHMRVGDIAILADLDEIPSCDAIKTIREQIQSGPVFFEMDLYYYNLNWLKKNKWCRAFAITKDGLEQYTIEDLRNHRCGSGQLISGGGWHLSYFLPPEQIAEKIRAFSHQEFNRLEFLDIDNIVGAIEGGRDLFNRGEDENLVHWKGQTHPKNKHLLPAYLQVVTTDLGIALMTAS
jgi:beta-1,4-mannosyl-glycoprotein beta-1,4-N-acetylglucosaminyltransferase